MRDLMENGLLPTALFTLAYLGVSAYLCRGYRPQTRDLALGGIACALTVVLSLLRIPLPTGASFAVGATIPLMLVGLLRDYRLGILSGWVAAVACLILVPAWAPVHWGQVFSEHLVCLSSLGYAGIWGRTGLKKWGGVALALALNWTGHFLSGVVFFGAYAWAGWSPWGYSLVYNLSQCAAESLLAVVALALLPLNTLAQAMQGTFQKAGE